MSCVINLTTPQVVLAAPNGCARFPTYSSPNRELNSSVGPWNVRVSSHDDCDGGVKVDLVAERSFPAGEPEGNPVRKTAQSSVITIPIFCRRDDYMFLPPGALGGIP